MILALLLIPMTAALLAFCIRSHSIRRIVWLTASALHFLGTLSCLVLKQDFSFYPVLALDALAVVFLNVTSFLFLLSSIQCTGYLRSLQLKPVNSFHSFFHSNPSSYHSESTFTGCLLLFLFSMTLAISSQHLGLLWIAIEATTLSSAPLISFHRNAKSLEATWKYLVICSVGIALALLGNVFLGIAVSANTQFKPSLLLTDLLQPSLLPQAEWLKISFIFFLAGYGTKMGLAPFHAWLPDAHSEAPSSVSALLSGTLLNCAFLGILRVQGILDVHGFGNYSRNLLIIFGLLSMGFAAVFILGQRDYKRLLAYSSIEHMGILSFGMGILAVTGVMFHLVFHSILKAMLFFLSGNILSFYKTKSIQSVRGVLQALPVTGFLFLIGFLALCGLPPFGIFFSEFLILKTAFNNGLYLQAIVFLILLLFLFIGMAILLIPMLYGLPKTDLLAAVPRGKKPETLRMILPALFLGVLGVLLSLWIPPVIVRYIQTITHSFGGF